MTNPIMTVTDFDLQRYLGTWYEIARLPIRFQQFDSSDVSAHYQLNEDGTVQVQNRCLNAAGELEQAIGQAKAIDVQHGKLEVSFLPAALRWLPFTKGDYWVLKLDADYQTALVGGSDHRYLWLLHRQHQLDAQTQHDFLAYAKDLGYDLSDLIQTPHTGRDTANMA